MPSFSQTAGNNPKRGATSRAIARQVRGDERSDREPWSAPSVVGAPITAAAAALFSPTRPHLGKVTPASPKGPRNRRRIQSLLTKDFFTITTAPKRPKRLLRSGPIGAPPNQLSWRVCDEYPWRCRFIEQWAWERVEAIEEVPTPVTQSTPATPTEEETWSEEGSGAGANPEIREPTTDGSGAGAFPEIIDRTIPTPTTTDDFPEIVNLITPTFPEIIDLVTPTFPEIIDLTTPTTIHEIIDLTTPTTGAGAADEEDRASPEIIDLVMPTTYDRP
ncbi:hypothetical protein MMC07_008555 [Pseudocyphellaria aurata]|nr:hypothetical protein [Pseudocyphellaria aurata]